MEKMIENLMLRFPETEGEWQELIKNQCEVFGDGCAFYDDLYIWAGKECTLAAFVDGEMAGAVSFPEITYPIKDKTYVGGYIFAAWVKPEYRGKGIFRALMEKAEEVMTNRGYDFAFVVPAEGGLFSLYEKMGYTLPVKNGFPYKAPREILREYNPTDDIYMLWKVYSYVNSSFAKNMDFFNHTMQVMEAEGKLFAISKRGYLVYAPCYDNTVIVYDRMEKGTLVTGGKSPVRGLCKSLGKDNMPENLAFNMFFEPEYEIFKK